ncbi:NAD(P)/FAD-dependent oxidoreductase [Mycolicibacterium sp. CH28]|uniref:phytoene desaturase family protein n=1 Tax=Mycolicibacterium sp. CH28 TaxID=2512237 RepID=UPI001080ED84|nr:NAD(P)/FAD-dependent oxidoreductase [Mycolicibacterium sp. CH28]TGD83917.1 NAD(P)/FAD-dependent oxidoreductase [Mycolicibacterium sp. CH28]
METFDYLVVGAGHNGLCAATTLAEQGRSVCVFDRLAVLGGLSASHAYLPEAPEHKLSIGAMDDLLMGQTPLAKQMRLADFGYDPIAMAHPYGWMNEEGDTLLLWHDFGRTLDEIQYFSPRDARTYEQLRGPIDWIMDLVDVLTVQGPSTWGPWDFGKYLLTHRPDRATRKFLGSLMTLTAFELVSETFESDAMRGLWAYWSSMVGPADAVGSGAYFLGFAGVHRHLGVQRPRGGMTNLVTAFQAKLESLGGQVRLGSGVAEILVANGRATGVRLDDGTEIQARYGVLSAAAPQVTFGQLVPREQLSRVDQDRIAMLPANSNNSAAFKIDVATSGRVGFPRAEAARAKRDDVDIRTTTFMTGTLEDHIAQLLAMKRGLNIDVPPVYMAILSATDSSLAPGDGNVLYLNSNAPAYPSNGWDANKERYAEQISKSALRFLDGLQTEIGRVVSTPQDLQTHFNAPAGAYFHVDMLVTRLGVNRPARGLGGYDTPITGLFQSGAGTHPSGGVTGWPGRLAAQHAIRQE